MKIEIIQNPVLKIKVDSKVIELTPDECKQLQTELNKLYPDNVPYRYYPYSSYGSLSSPSIAQPIKSPYEVTCMSPQNTQ